MKIYDISGVGVDELFTRRSENKDNSLLLCETDKRIKDKTIIRFDGSDYSVIYVSPSFDYAAVARLDENINLEPEELRGKAGVYCPYCGYIFDDYTYQNGLKFCPSCGGVFSTCLIPRYGITPHRPPTIINLDGRIAE